MLTAGYVILLMMSVAFARAALDLVRRFLQDHDMVDLNFRGERIPTACGLLLPLLLAAEVAVRLIADRAVTAGGTGPTVAAAQDAVVFWTYGLGVGLVAFVGFIDDAMGVKHVKGLSGHWSEWREQRVISTGVVKAGGTAIAALWFVLPISRNESIWQIVCQIVMLALMANGVNLLDVRPGRALKVFFLLFAAIAVEATASGYTSWYGWQGALPYVLPVLAGACALFRPDLQGKLMIGDSGANVLGFAAGCWSIMFCSAALQIAMLAACVLLHGLAWRSSLSHAIERHPLLLWLDLLGRGRT
ncbi:hypothetical protein [Paenibacillus xerothermodurans]|nr:hypothetical protein [Paenibacillus xerothermodurans]